MVFMLLDRKDPSSFFAPYYDILPPTLNNMPIFWNEAELKNLEGSYLLDQIDERNAAISADYSAICNVVPQFHMVATLDEFKWARMCVCSRNFGLIVNGVRTAALVPYADMLNHYRPRETKWQYEDSSQAFTIVSLQGIGAGAQVYDSYGQKCNHRFLLNYGFSVENNVEPDGFCPNEVSPVQSVLLLFLDNCYCLHCQNVGDIYIYIEREWIRWGYRFYLLHC
jgi:protein-histidine N-methyltransferase